MMRVIFNCIKCGKRTETKHDSPFAKSNTCYHCTFLKAFEKKKEDIAFENMIHNNFIVTAMIFFVVSVGMIYNMTFGFEIEVIGRMITAMGTGGLFGIAVMSLLFGMPKR